MNSQNYIIGEINDLMARFGGNYPDWYIGITSDPENRLFSAHNLRKGTDPCTYYECSDSGIAREIEDYFIALGMIGGSGGGGATTRYVYAYKIAGHTIETA